MVAQHVGTIRRDLEFQNGVRRKQFLGRFPDRRVGGKNEQTFGILGQCELFGAAHHAVGRHPAQLARLDFEIRTEHRTGQSERDLVPYLVIFRPANNLARLTGSVVDLANAQSVGIGMLLAGKNLRHDHFVGDVAAVFASDHFGAAVGQQLAQRFRRAGQRHVILEPLEGNLHEGNCARKRWSFSTNMRMSGTP